MKEKKKHRKKKNHTKQRRTKKANTKQAGNKRKIQNKRRTKQRKTNTNKQDGWKNKYKESINENTKIKMLKKKTRKKSSNHINEPKFKGRESRQEACRGETVSDDCLLVSKKRCY